MLFKSLVAFAAVANAAVVQQPRTQSNLMKLRGGFDVPDGATIASYYFKMKMIDATLETISGSKSAVDVVDKWSSGGLASAVGYWIFADKVLGGGDAKAAVVAAALPGLIGAFKNWLNNGKNLDLSGDNVSFLINAFLIYSMHYGSFLDGDLALKIFAGLNLVNGLGGMFASDLVSSLPWSGADSPALAAGTGAAVLALGGGSSAGQAIAYSVLPALWNSIDAQFISKSGGDDVATIMMLWQLALVATNIQ